MASSYNCGSLTHFILPRLTVSHLRFFLMVLTILMNVSSFLEPGNKCQVRCTKCSKRVGKVSRKVVQSKTHRSKGTQEAVFGQKAYVLLPETSGVVAFIQNALNQVSSNHSTTEKLSTMYLRGPFSGQMSYGRFLISMKRPRWISRGS
jgi:hypothetical protein